MIDVERTMKKTALYLTLIQILIFPCLMTAQTSDTADKEVYAPFVSRIKAETRGTAIVLSWKDARNLSDPLYHIYESWQPFDDENFPHSRRIATVERGAEHYLYEPGDSNPRYFLILAEEEGQLFDVFIPYRNMNMKAVSAEKAVIQEKKAARISDLLVVPESQNLLITAAASDSERSLILFRSTDPLLKREDLKDAARVRIFKGERIEIRDHVVPGIPFYYALVDKALYESGSTILLYDGSVTPAPVSIPMEQWNPEEAHSFLFASSHIPLPMLNMELDIERGKKLPDPGLPRTVIALEPETEAALAELNFGKSVHTPLWMRPELLPVDKAVESPPETAWVEEIIVLEDWKALLEQSDEQLKNSFDREIRNRLLFYRGQARYFLGDLEYAFMDFLSARDGYYSESGRWLYNIFEQRLRISRSRNLE